ncbi:hypothetical protein [uncultured Thiodictyon sp.]|uniref:hypothetical protein n=1 Tax=uncultured Thiodictyon sp. TaxID=1846217 RepID=UPI0025F2A8D3|nr:hypothetical protein [uncultured Thiodictyon sp.]
MGCERIRGTTITSITTTTTTTALCWTTPYPLKECDAGDAAEPLMAACRAYTNGLAGPGRLRKSRRPCSRSLIRYALA